MKEYYNTREVDNDMKKLLLQRNKLNLRNVKDLPKARELDDKLYQLKNLRARM